MSSFTVDQARCTRCGRCRDACPMRIIVTAEEDAFPLWVTGADDLCIHCGHCVAICPAAAISLADMTATQCPALDEKGLWSPEQAERFLKARRSIRVFRDQSVDRDVIERLLTVAGYAPSGHNSQPVQWLIISDRNEIKNILNKMLSWARNIMQKNPALARESFVDRYLAEYDAGKDPFLRHAPHIVVAHALRGDNLAAASCIIATTYLELAAFSCGLGTCWNWYFHTAANNWAPLRNALNLPAGHAVYGSVLLGYPRYEYQRVPLRNKPNINWR